MIKVNDIELFNSQSYRKNHVEMVKFLGEHVFHKDFSSHDDDKVYEQEEDTKIRVYKNLNPEHFTTQDREKINRRDFEHLKSSPHHPEYWDDNITEDNYDFQNPPTVHAEKMPKDCLIEMCCDWASCAISNNGSFSTWYNKVIDKRFIFTKGQKTIIKNTLQKIYDFTTKNNVCFGGVLKYQGKEPKFKESMEKEKFTVAFIFGRMNPFTIGHLKVVDKLLSLNADDFRLYLSHTQDKPNKKNPLKCKNPLSFLLKRIYINFILKDNHIPLKVEESEARTIFAVLEDLYKEGVTDIKIVAGSDRILDFKELLEKYNGGIDPKTNEIGYEFNTIEVVSAGERDPDGDDVESMSASKLRQLVVEDNFEEFKKGIPTKDENLIKDLFEDIKKGMGL